MALDVLFKSRDITLPTKFLIVNAMVFPVVMYGCENWTIKKAEHWRIDAFEPQCWRRLLRVPWTARRSNHSILKEISPEYSLEGLMLKLKLMGSVVVVAHWLSCSTASGIFLSQGPNQCPLHWQADSHPLYHQESSPSLSIILSSFWRTMSDMP